MCRRMGIYATMTLMLLGRAAALGAEASTAPQEEARSILTSADITGGLVVHLGCGDGRLTAALKTNDNILVHGLDQRDHRVAAARRHIKSLGIYGPVCIDTLRGATLPYVDNLVNLVIVEPHCDVARSEIMRVLVPRGVALIRNGKSWNREVKPPCKNTDEWTHYAYDASGNAVAHDTVVGPPGRMQWVAGPRHTRSHEHIPSINSVVSSAGRIFYVQDQASIEFLREPPKWHLVARDAYNGTLLWERAMGAWFPHIVNWGYTPGQLQRRLVAIKDRLYATLGIHAPLSAIDARTGNIIHLYENTKGTDEVVYHQGILLLVVREVTDDRQKELVHMARLSAGKHSSLFDRESAESLVRHFRSTENRTPCAVRAVNAETGELLWEKHGDEVSGLRSLSLCAAGNRVFYQRAGDVICLDLDTGNERWRTSSATLRLVCDDSVFCGAGSSVMALSAESGQVLWRQEPLLTSIRDMFVANDSLWLGGFKPFPQKRSPAWGPYFATSRDLRTGEVLMHVECDNPGHHHRCYSNKATDRYILAGRRGTEFIDLNTGEVREHSWARGVCKYGIMPCNGLMYAPPHACACYVGARVSGFTALAPLRLPEQSGSRPDERAHVERGAAYGRDASREEAADTSACWPTYRGDCSRSGSTGAHVPTNLACKWKRRIGETPSSPVVAGGLLLVTDVETHAVHALDAASGEPIWTYTAGGRIDSPPTVACNRAVFGCADGSVYCLTASDGELVWRFIPDQTGRRIVAQGQLESVRPTHGSVLIQDNIVSFAAGRSSYLDGGISLYRLNLATGEVLTKTPVYSPDPETGKQPPQSAPYSIPGVRSDILVGDGDRIYLREMTFDNAGKKCLQGKSHLFTLTDFLDDSWPHRSYWIFGREISIACGCSGRRRGLIYGRLLVFNHSTVFGYGRSNVHWSNQLQDGPYRVFAIGREGKDEDWERHVGIHARAMVLTDNVLFAAGPVVQQEPGPGAPDRTEKAELIALAPGDGALIGRVSIDTPPIFDGMAATPGHLYLTLEDGNVACLSANAR